MGTSSLYASHGIIRSISALVNSGKNVDEIASERSETKESVEKQLEKFGLENYKAQDRVAYVDQMHRKGVHPSVIAIIMRSGTKPDDSTINTNMKEAMTDTAPVSGPEDRSKEIIELMKSGHGLKQIVEKLNASMSEVIEAVRSAEESAVSGEPTQEETTEVVASVEPDESKEESSKPLPKNKSVSVLARQGFTLDEIRQHSGAKEQTVTSYLEGLGYKHRGKKIDEAAAVLKEKGFHSSVVAVILNVDESIVLNHLQLSLKNRIPEMVQNGLSTKQIMDTLGVGYDLVSKIRKETTQASASGLSKAPLPDNKQEGSSFSKEPLVFEKEDEVELLSVTVGAEEAQASEPATAVNPVSQTDPQDEPRDVTTEVVRLCKLNHTLREIAEELGIKRSEVIHIANDEKVFFPYTDQVRLQLDTAARLATDGATLEEIAEATEVSKTQLRKLFSGVIKGNGRGRDIFSKLLEDERVLNQTKHRESKESSPAAAHSVTLTPLLSPTNISVGDAVKFHSPADEEAREGTLWLQGRTVEVEAVLNGVAMVSLPYKGAKAYELALLTEISAVRDDSSWIMGETVTFFIGDSEHIGVVKSPPLTLDNEIKYALSVNGEDQLVNASDFKR